MPYKDKAKQREAQRKWAKENRSKFNKYVANARKERREYVNAYKNRPCLDCGQAYDPCVMDLHHREGEEKLKNLAIMASERYTYKMIDAELAKCDPLCANCHRMRHKRANVHA
jgi:hypothetical protein